MGGLRTDRAGLTRPSRSFHLPASPCPVSKTEIGWALRPSGGVRSRLRSPCGPGTQQVLMMVAARIIPCKAHLQAKYPQVICPLKCGSAVSPCDLGCPEQTDQSARLKDALTVPPQPESSTYPGKGRAWPLELTGAGHFTQLRHGVSEADSLILHLTSGCSPSRFASLSPSPGSACSLQPQHPSLLTQLSCISVPPLSSGCQPPPPGSPS